MGYAVGSSCYRDPVEAANAYCARLSGVTSEGVLSCDGASPGVGQALLVDFTFASSTTSASRSMEVQLPECEPFDITGAAPLLWTAVVGAIAISSLRRLRAIFSRETL